MRCSYDFGLDFYDHEGRHRTPRFRTEHASHVHLLKHAGKRSISLKAQVSLAAFCDWFCDDQEQRGCGRRTVDQDRSRYRRRLWGPLGNPAMADVSVEDLESLALGWTNLAPQTKRDMAYSIIRLFDAAWEEGVVSCNNARLALGEFTRCHTIVVTKVADAVDVERILAAANPRLHLALRLAMDGYLTESELAALRTSDFSADLQKMTVRFRLEAGEEVLQPRVAKERTVTLSPRTVALLREWLGREYRPSKSPFLFSSENGERLSSPILIHLRRAQYRLRMAAVERTRPPRAKRAARHRRKPFQLFVPRLSLGDITDLQVIQWYAQGVGKKEILARCGLKSVSRLDRFKAYFDRIDRNRGSFDAIDDLV